MQVVRIHRFFIRFHEKERSERDREEESGNDERKKA